MEYLTEEGESSQGGSFALRYLVNVPDPAPRPQRLVASPHSLRVPPPQRRDGQVPHQAAAAEEQVLHSAHEHRSHDSPCVPLAVDVVLPARGPLVPFTRPPLFEQPHFIRGGKGWRGGVGWRRAAARGQGQPAHKLLFHSRLLGRLPGMPALALLEVRPRAAVARSRLEAHPAARLSFLTAYINLR